MSYQLPFDFETPEQKEQRLKDWHDQQVKLDKIFEGKANDYYIYNKYVDIKKPTFRGWACLNIW